MRPFFLVFLNKFLVLENKVSLKVLLDKKSYSLNPWIINNDKNEFILLNNKTALDLFTTNLLKFSINLKKIFYGFNQQANTNKNTNCYKSFLN